LSETNPEELIGYVNSLRLLEKTVCLLYQAIAEKTVETTAKSHLLKISYDSLEHSKLLKAFMNRITFPEQTSKPSHRKTAEAKEEVTKLSQKIQAIERITGFEFSQMFEELMSLENCLSEDYQNLASLNLSQTLEHIFLDMYNDEEFHQQLLGTVKSIVCPSKAEGTDTPPPLKYQNPDNWNRSLP